MENDENYYDEVFAGYSRLEDNREAEIHFFENTEPPEGQPTGSRAMDIDKAKAIASEFIQNCRISVMINARRVWYPPPNGILPSAEAREQPLAYAHPNDINID